jgi:hypothetical protein
MKRFFIAAFLSLGLSMAAFSQDKATANLSIVVNAAVVTIAPSTLPPGMVGTVYGGVGTTISASGGLAPYTFAISAGTLPAGVVLGSSTGALTGAPTASGLFTFTVKATDSEATPATAAQVYSINVLATLAITTISLPSANLGVAYSSSVAASGGQSPYTFAVTLGSLPTGLTLNGSTGAITGTPTAAGTFTFTITVTDSATNVAMTHVEAVIVAENKVKTKKGTV